MPPKLSKKKKKGAGKQQRLGTAARKEGMARYYKSLPSLPPNTVIESIKRGEDIPLEVVFDVVTDCEEKQKNEPDKVQDDQVVIYKKLVDAGLVSAAIGVTVTGCTEKHSSGDIFSPRMCMMLLANMSNNENKHRLQIAKGIQPLIKCMINVEKREYFGSNKHWHESIKVFIMLISNLALSNEVLDILVHTNDELTSFMVQSMFWGTHRQEDIVKESKVCNISKSPVLYFSSISTEAASFLQGLVERCNEKSDEGKKKIRELATMPIVSTNNRCESALIYGLIDILKLCPNDMRPFIALLHRLTLGDCVDKEVVAGIIELGYTSTKTYDDAMPIACVISGILIPQLDARGSIKGYSAPIDVTQTDDGRFAYAIGCGLFEVCLSLISRHGGYNNGNGTRMGNMNNSIKNIMDAANIVTFQKKSSKSLSERRDNIVGTMNKTSIPENESCQEIIRALKSIVSRKVGQKKLVKAKSTCNTCKRYLSADDIRRCSKCNTSYCSRECQLEDWHNRGHKQECKLLSKDKHTKKSQMEKKEMALKANMSDAGTEIFTQNAMRFMTQAVIFQYEITECVCLMDLRQAPPLFRLLPIDEFVSEYLKDENSDNFFKSREMSRRKVDGSLLSGAIISHGVNTNGQGGLSLLFLAGDHWEECVSKMMVPFKSSRKKLDDPKVQEDLLSQMDKAESEMDALSILKSVME